MKILLPLLAILALFGHPIHCSPSNDTCLACKSVVDFIWKVSNRADDDLYASLTTLCSQYSYMPGQSSDDVCNKTLHNVFEFINERLDKDKLCYDIDACMDGGDDGIREIRYYPNTDPTDCEFCIYASTKIKELLVGGPSEMMVKAHIEDVCHYMRSYEDECLKKVDDYIDAVFKFLQEKFNPNKLCRSLRVCTGPRTGPLPDDNVPSSAEMVNILPVNFTLVSDRPAIGSNGECILCKQIVAIIQRQLRNNATDDEIVNVLQEACELSPAKDRAKCRKVVDQYSRELIQILTQVVDPDTACIMVGLCANQYLQDYLHGRPISSNRIDGDRDRGTALCTECELIAHFIQNEMYNYKNEEQIENFIKNHLCTRLSYLINTANCQAFIDEYGPIIMQTIAQDLFNPDVLCYKKLHVCKRAAIRVISSNDKIQKKCSLCLDIVENLENASVHQLDSQQIIEQVCANYSGTRNRAMCQSMVKSFAPLIMDNMGRFDDNGKICESIDICLKMGQSHYLGGEKCTYGPSYWCHTVSHANACNAFKYCHQQVWSNQDPQSGSNN